MGVANTAHIPDHHLAQTLQFNGEINFLFFFFLIKNKTSNNYAPEQQPVLERVRVHKYESWVHTMGHKSMSSGYDSDSESKIRECRL